MARLYYANNGVMDLKPSTLDALRRLPKAWDIVLNLRPLNGKTARELDAVVITQRAIHVLEFKQRKAPVTVVSDSRWLSGGREDRNGVRGGESPSEQVCNSTKAFQEVLTGKFAQLRDLTLPWVVLETLNPANRVGNEAHPMPTQDWHDAGWAKVIHGLDYLEALLRRREEKMTECITDMDAEHFRRHFGAKPLGQLTTQGVALLLDNRERLQNTALCLTTLSTRQVFETTTDGNGAFELQGMPLEAFEVTVPSLPELRVLPGATFKATTELLVMHVFLVRPQVSEERIQELLSAEMDRVRSDVEAVLELAQGAEQRLANLEGELAQTRQTIGALMGLPSTHDNEVMHQTINGLIAKVEELERQRRQVDAVTYLDPDVVRRDALSPLQAELDALATRVGALETRLDKVGQTATRADQRARRALDDATGAKQMANVAGERAGKAESSARDSAQSARQAQGHAAMSEAEAQRAADEARISRKVQEDELKFKQAVYLTEEERRQKRAEALKLSAIVGAVGGIISMQPIPFADNVILTPMQIWLVVRIGQFYGQSITQDAALKLLGTVGFGFAAQHATVALYKLIPGLTFGLGPFTVFGFTVLLGAATALFYERGSAPGRSEQKALMGGIKVLLGDRTFREDVMAMGRSVFKEFKVRGYKTGADDLRAVFDIAGERARPIGDRLERELFGKDGNRA
ncbi:NERD domain-containing protein [Deinococcus arenicola]|uniref:NERD domain-containing protein n=1 Tax=Deinococcus arenicola TaxID=2994950 RepID=A0ABU4DMS9_9DEIO|nr:NERD domain-containing protein [Deinococcus sp. ZS9-10]MDV6373663.1 NERD domain-containing protein [Deinococcus sp. ZS9-10]